MYSKSKSHNISKKSGFIVKKILRFRLQNNSRPKRCRRSCVYRPTKVDFWVSKKSHSSSQLELQRTTNREWRETTATYSSKYLQRESLTCSTVLVFSKDVSFKNKGRLRDPQFSPKFQQPFSADS